MTKSDPRVRVQPMLAVADVPVSSQWYQEILGARSAHGGDEYDQLTVDGEMLVQLHAAGRSHHHERLDRPGVPVGNGFILWFAVSDFQAAVRRCHAAAVTIVTDVHFNPNANQREIWIRDPDGYLVVLAESAN